MRSNPIQTATHSKHANWLPVIDWNVKFYGAHLQKVEEEWSMPMEAHVGFEILVLLKGSQETTMERNRYLLHTGDILLIPPGFKHENKCASRGGMLYFTAHFNVDDPLFREEMIKNSRFLFHSESEENRKLRQIIDDWISMSRRNGDYSTMDRFRLQARLFELLSLLTQFACANPGWEHHVSPSSAQYAKAIAEAIKLRFNPYDPDEKQLSPLFIKEIITSLGISPGYGLEVFRKVYGMSPRAYLSELKLNEAKVLIQQAQLSLQEVASKLGYSHLSHFSRQFKRWTGMSPIQYRQSGQQ